MRLAGRLEAAPPNIPPQGTPLDDLVVNVTMRMIGRLTHIDPRAQVSRACEVSPQEGQLRLIAARLGSRSHDPTTDTPSTLAGVQVYDEA